MKWPARYIFNEVKSITSVIRASQNRFISEDISNLEPIRRLVVAFLTLSLAVNRKQTQFNFKTVFLTRIFPNGSANVDHDTGHK